MSITSYTKAKIDQLLALKASLPSPFVAYAPITSGVDANAPLTFTTSQKTVARALGWLIATDPQWGAAPGTNSTAALRAAIDFMDGWDNVTKAYTGAARGGTLWCPGSVLPYDLDSCLVMSARCRVKGASGNSAGGVATAFRAVGGGDFTNVDALPGGGLFPGQAYMVRLSRNDTEWFHGGSFEDIELRANGLFVGGLAGNRAGEGSLINNVHVHGTGTQTRTKTATFNGTATVTLSGGDASALEDFRARVTCPSFPVYADFVKSDAVTTTNSADVTFPSGGVTTALVGAEVTAGNTGFRSTAYVQSVNAGTSTVTLSVPLPVGSVGATGRTMTLGRPRDFRIDQINSATVIELDRPVPYTGTATLTIYRGRPGIRFANWGATGRIGSVNLTGNSGSGIEFLTQPANLVDVISGDDNGGPLIRYHQCGIGNQASVHIGAIKIENNNYGDVTDAQFENYSRHDPAVAFTSCGMINVNVGAASVHAGDRGTRALIRIQQSIDFNAGYPSLTIDGVEADDPYNVRFDWLLYDRDVGGGIIPAGVITSATDARMYPTVEWNKNHHTYGDTFLRKVPFTALGGGLTADGPLTPGNNTTSGAPIYSGTAAPAISAPLGAVYVRKAQPGWRTTFYVCTTASTANVSAWTPYEELVGQNTAPDSWQVMGWRTPPILTQGTWTSAYGATQMLTHIGYNASNAQNDEVRWLGNLAKGTYRLDVLADTGPDHAIATWEASFDGGTTWTGGTLGLALGAFDLYTAGAVANKRSATTGLVLPQSGPLMVRMRAATRNATPATGWVMSLGEACLQRTS